MRIRRTIHFLAVTLLLLSASQAFAVEFVVPEQVIVGAEKQIEPGELVQLALSPVKNAPEYLISSGTRWQVFDGTDPKSVMEHGSGVFFGAGVRPKKLLAVCAVTHLYGVRDKDGKFTQLATRTVILSAVVTIGMVPGPDPPPPPPPPPNPLPDGKYKLAKAVYDIANSTVPATKRVSATALAASFRGIASAIAAGTINSPADILTRTNASNQTAAGANRADWIPFFTTLQDVIWNLYVSGQMTTADDFRQAWTEIAAGLEAVR